MNMLKRLASAAILFLFAHSAGAYQVISDRAIFYSMFEKPASVLDFTALKDGTVFRTDGYLNSPLITTTGGSPFSASVREEGWADGLLIGSSYQGCGCAWSATNWFGDYIAPAGFTYYNNIYVNTGRQSMPIAVETSSGFLGYVPDNISDSYYLLPYQVSVTSLSYGFSPVTSVPEPSSAALLLVGLVAIARLRKRAIFRSVA
jgi:hypothetical protein